MNKGESSTVSGLFVAWRGGDERALEQLIPLLYDELHSLAKRHLRGEREGHTLQTTALIHEAYLRLMGSEVDWQDRAHFFAVAASTMRRVLVDHARGRAREKRGGGAVHVSLNEAIATPGSDSSEDVLALNDALDRLAKNDERRARVVELHYFGGLTYDDVAVALDISPATVHRELRLARAWLYRELHEGGTLSADE